MQENARAAELLTGQEIATAREAAEKLICYELLTGERVKIVHGENESERQRALTDFLLTCLREERE